MTIKKIQSLLLGLLLVNQAGFAKETDKNLLTAMKNKLVNDHTLLPSKAYELSRKI